MNRLADAASPYLAQHADNPVDWYPWSDEAFAAARDRDVPILLSVGYSACHWCHVMAHESFEDPETADYLNAHYVSIKVDREERPDVDRIYMDAVQALTGRGGWPMTVFLTPDGRPFYGGTYFPKSPRPGMVSFRQLLERIHELWERERHALVDQADRLTAAIREAVPPAGDTPHREALDQAIDRISATYDGELGGFGNAPKFPQPSTLEYLLRYAAIGGDPDRRALATRMATVTLDHMQRGGIHDQLGGGFARYSVDRHWLVPHFEKMLYDNALLARVYLRAWQITADTTFLATARSTYGYLLSDMSDPLGGFHSAEDADSEGTEGRYYVWTWEELGAAVGDRRDIAARIYGATPEGNFDGANILHLPRPLPETARLLGVDADQLAMVKASIDDDLRAARSARTRPDRDDKLVTAWNALALRSFAEAAAILDDPAYLAAATRIAEYLVDAAAEPDGLRRSRRGHQLGPRAFCDDHAASAIGLFTLFGVDGNERWFRAAEQHVATLLGDFADPDGGFFATRADGETLIARPKNLQDSPVPSDNALAAEALLMHHALTGDDDAVVALEATVRAAATTAIAHPTFSGHLLATWLTYTAGIDEVAIVGDAERRRPLERVVWERFRPTAIVAVGDGTPTDVPLLEDRPGGATATAHVCHDLICELPVSDPDALRVLLETRPTTSPGHRRDPEILG